MKKRKVSLSFAESCTGGKLSALLTEQAGVSSFFLGSVVSYSNEVKCHLLGVDQNAINEFGAVSEVVARLMASGVREKMKSDWSLSITGIAGPTGGTVNKPVGTICFAVVGPNFEESLKMLFLGSRKEIQKQAVDYGVNFLAQSINKH